MSHVWAIAAKRTPVVPRDGAFKLIEVTELGAAVIRSLLEYIAIPASARVEVVFGNALYGGGNPSRVAALAAGLSEIVPALTLDTQCCGGLDAIALGCSRIRSGDADVVIAGGLESFSRAPFRYRKSLTPGDKPEYYKRPPFTPWPDRDPDLVEAAASLARETGITRVSQEAYAIESHSKARAAGSSKDEIVPISRLSQDAFIRHLTAPVCARLPEIAGTPPYGITPATTAVEADAAAALVLVSEALLSKLSAAEKPVRMVGSIARGFDPGRPALAPIDAALALLEQHSLGAGDLAAVEVMEAFAVQAQAFITALALDPAIVNRGGGALSRGHPIGASGAILAVRLFHELRRERSGATGLAAIAAAGGLGSALLMSPG